MVHAPFRWLTTVALAAVCVACNSTPDVRRSFGDAAPDAIVLWETWEVGGVPHDVLVRGRSRRAPMALVLHGGPGVSETALFRHYLAAMEDHFVMVYWDQPGTGRSYSDAALRRGLDIETILRDLDELVDRLRAIHRQEKVVLIGHSWGSALALLYAARHSEKLSLVVGVGQVASMPEGEAASYAYALKEAGRRQHGTALQELQAVGSPPHGVDAMLTSRRWVERFGGTFSAGLSTGKMILAAMQEPEATWWDLVRFGRGNRASLEALWPAFSQLDLRRAVPAVQVPVIFALGSRDRVTPPSLAQQYLAQLQAPCKRAIVVEGAAHNLVFERPRWSVALLADLARRLKASAAPEEVCQVHSPAEAG